MTQQLSKNHFTVKSAGNTTWLIAVVLIPMLHLCVDAQGQSNSFWITFEDKGGQTVNDRYISEAAIENRIRLGINPLQYSDLPPAKAYIDAVAKYGHVYGQSKWLNAIVAELDANALLHLQRMPFIKSIRPTSTSLHPTSAVPLRNQTLAGFAIEQVSAAAFRKEQLSGKGVTIGIIDGNFEGAAENPSLSHVFKTNQVLGSRDFVNNISIDFLKGHAGSADNHGTLVWQLIAGKDNDESHAPATDASFYLARTDVTEHEFRKEELFWITALEWMDSLGVRLVNSSLGYSIDFDDPLENHKPEEMNGAGAMATAARIAVEEKGMIIVVSAGNDGNNEAWKINSTPADASGVITVGASDESGMKLQHSAIGSPFVPYLKPNVVCFSSAGTSFSTPVVTGLIACMLQKDPHLKSDDIRNILEQSSHLFPYGNNYMGMGIPNAQKILDLMNRTSSKNNISATEITARGSRVSIRIKNNDSSAIAFHKSDPSKVVSQEYLLLPKRNLVIRKPEGCSRSTIVMSDQVVEIVWK